MTCLGGFLKLQCLGRIWIDVWVWLYMYCFKYLNFNLFNYKVLLNSQCSLYVLGSKLQWFPYNRGYIEDGHQPNSRVLYTHYEDSLTIPYIRSLDPGTYSNTLHDHWWSLYTVLLFPYELFSMICRTPTSERQYRRCEVCDHHSPKV